MINIVLLFYIILLLNLIKYDYEQNIILYTIYIWLSIRLFIIYLNNYPILICKPNIMKLSNSIDFIIVYYKINAVIDKLYYN